MYGWKFVSELSESLSVKAVWTDLPYKMLLTCQESRIGLN